MSYDYAMDDLDGAQPDDYGEEECLSCGAPLLQPGGYAGSGMCGPCCTGEADTIDEITD